MEVYVFVVDGGEWEDIVVYTSREDAIKKSKKHPGIRVEIFTLEHDGGYRPSYSHFLNGELIAH
jgi:hypothetical protein